MLKSLETQIEISQQLKYSLNGRNLEQVLFTFPVDGRQRFFQILIWSQFENSSFPGHCTHQKNMFPNKAQIKKCSSLSFTLMKKYLRINVERAFEQMQMCHTKMIKQYCLTQSRGTLSREFQCTGRTDVLHFPFLLSSIQGSCSCSKCQYLTQS